MKFGVDYDIGWAGFTNTGGAIADAIGYGERWERREARRGTPTVTHAFMAISPTEGIEAHLDTGVAVFKLSKYFNDKDCKVYFRKPRNWSVCMGADIVSRAKQSPPFGHPYDCLLIGAMAFNYTYLGHALNWVSFNRFKRFSCQWCSQPLHYICSETVATVLRTTPSVRRVGCLLHLPCTVDPQELFDDDKVFEVTEQVRKHRQEIARKHKRK